MRDRGDPASTNNDHEVDHIRLNLADELQLGFWSREFGVTPERLREVVREVGPVVKDVKAKLSR